MADGDEPLYRRFFQFWKANQEFRGHTALSDSRHSASMLRREGDLFLEVAKLCNHGATPPQRRHLPHFHLYLIKKMVPRPVTQQQTYSRSTTSGFTMRVRILGNAPSTFIGLLLFPQHDLTPKLRIGFGIFWAYLTYGQVMDDDL